MKKIIILIVAVALASCQHKPVKVIKTNLEPFISKVTYDSNSTLYINIQNDTATITTVYRPINGDYSTVYDNENVTDDQGNFHIQDSFYWYIPFDKYQDPVKLQINTNSSIICLCAELSKKCIKVHDNRSFRCQPGQENPCPDCNAGVTIAEMPGVIIRAKVLLYNDKPIEWL